MINDDKCLSSDTSTPHVASQQYYHFIISSIFIVFTLSNLSFEAMKSAVAYRPSKVPSWKRLVHQIPSTCCFDMFQSVLFLNVNVDACWCTIPRSSAFVRQPLQNVHTKRSPKINQYKLEIWKEYRSLPSKWSVTMNPSESQHFVNIFGYIFDKDGL